MLSRLLIAANEVQSQILSSACNGDASCQANATNGITHTLTNVTNTLLFAVGAISIIVIIIGGLRFVLSRGTESNVKAGRETILYAVIGLAIAMSAYAIVNFVLVKI